METLPTVQTKTEPNRNEEWSDEDRETAFELWLANGQPSIAQVTRLVRQELDKAIPHETIRVWFHRHQWQIEADRRLAALTPNLMIRSAVQLTVAAAAASRYVQDVWTPDPSDARKTVQPFDRDRHAAALAVCAAVGFSPGSKARPQLPSPSESDASDHTADPADAAARIAERRQRWGR